MKIIIWNCKMKFRQKFHEVFNLKPDILVIPESENIERMNITTDQ